MLRLIKFNVVQNRNQKNKRKECVITSFSQLLANTCDSSFAAYKSSNCLWGWAQNKTQNTNLCFDSEKSPLDKDGCVEWEWTILSSDDPQRNTSKTWQRSCLHHSESLERTEGKSNTAPQLRHTACPITSVFYVYSGPCFLTSVACDGFDSAGLVHGVSCWAGGSGDDV